MTKEKTNKEALQDLKKTLKPLQKMLSKIWWEAFSWKSSRPWLSGILTGIILGIILNIFIEC